MPGRRVDISVRSSNGRDSFHLYATCCVACAMALALPHPIAAQESPSVGATKPAAASPAPRNAEADLIQAELEAALSKMLTGATLEGSYTSTDGGRAAAELKRDKYTLGEVKKLEGNLWLIQARIQYRDAEAVMVPLPLPIEWAGDTPVITVDNFTIPGMGTFSARVMFFDDHYAGYWKHDDRGGNLFGVVHRPDAAAPAEKPAK